MWLTTIIVCCGLEKRAFTVEVEESICNAMHGHIGDSDAL